MRRARAWLALILLAATPALAHDFWLEPSTFRVAPDEPIPVRILVGDQGNAENWALSAHRVVGFRSIGPDGIIDHSAALDPAARPGDPQGSVTLHSPGTHVVSFETTPAENDLPATAFDAYVAHEGLTAVAAHRRTVAAGSNGREIYARRAKLLLQVGDTPTDHAMARVGQSLELVPEADPFALQPGQMLPVRVWFRGQSLVGATIHMAALDGAHGSEQSAISDSEGRVHFTMGQGRRYRVSTVWSVPIVHPRADYDTLFASLTFGR